MIQQARPSQIPALTPVASRPALFNPLPLFPCLNFQSSNPHLPLVRLLFNPQICPISAAGLQRPELQQQARPSHIPALTLVAPRPALRNQSYLMPCCLLHPPLPPMPGLAHPSEVLLLPNPPSSPYLPLRPLSRSLLAAPLPARRMSSSSVLVPKAELSAGSRSSGTD